MGELSIFFGLDLARHEKPSDMFNFAYTPDWLQDDLAKEMLEVIDGCTYNGEYSIKSRVLGNISPYMLSGGLRTLLALRNVGPENFLVDLAFMGQNCMYYLSKILEEKDLKMVCNTFHNSFYNYPVKGICENDGSRFNNAKEFNDKLFEWLPKRQERNIPEGYHEGEGEYYWSR